MEVEAEPIVLGIPKSQAVHLHSPGKRLHPTMCQPASTGIHKFASEGDAAEILQSKDYCEIRDRSVYTQYTRKLKEMAAAAGEAGYKNKKQKTEQSREDASKNENVNSSSTSQKSSPVKQKSSVEAGSLMKVKPDPDCGESANTSLIKETAEQSESSLKPTTPNPFSVENTKMSKICNFPVKQEPAVSSLVKPKLERSPERSLLLQTLADTGNATDTPNVNKSRNLEHKSGAPLTEEQQGNPSVNRQNLWGEKSDQQISVEETSLLTNPRNMNDVNEPYEAGNEEKQGSSYEDGYDDVDNINYDHPEYRGHFLLAEYFKRHSEMEGLLNSVEMYNTFKDEFIIDSEDEDSTSSCSTCSSHDDDDDDVDDDSANGYQIIREVADLLGIGDGRESDEIGNEGDVSSSDGDEDENEYFSRGAEE